MVSGISHCFNPIVAWPLPADFMVSLVSKFSGAIATFAFITYFGERCSAGRIWSSMNISLNKLRPAGWQRVVFASALVLTPLAGSAQNTFYGAGGPTNAATNVSNLAFGYQAMANNLSGYRNTASGTQALYFNTSGFENTVMGYQALSANVSGYDNTANGYLSLFSNTTGYYNTANGNSALYLNTTGSRNTAIGWTALAANTTGSYNTAAGWGAGGAITIGSYNIDIGNVGVGTENGAIRIGTDGVHTSTYIAGINGVASPGGVAVFINSVGQLGTLPSSRRFKSDIANMGSLSDRLMQLRPVTFRYNAADEKGAHPLQYGLIAEEVAKVYPELVQYDNAGKPSTIYYHLLTPLMLSAVQKVHRHAEAQSVETGTLKLEVASFKQSQQRQFSELALFKQTQRTQLKALAKLEGLVQTSPDGATVRQASNVRN
jgi:hypothetical protein